jgi:DNA-binding transcriptional LysR family regulator
VASSGPPNHGEAAGARRSLVEQVERAAAQVRDAAADQRSRMRLAVPSGISRLFTSGRLAELRREYPELALEIVVGSRPVDLGKGRRTWPCAAAPSRTPTWWCASGAIWGSRSTPPRRTLVGRETPACARGPACGIQPDRRTARAL